MNPNVLWGTVSFVLWSIFSTWYYLNYIKSFPEDPVTVAKPAIVAEPDKPPVESSAETPIVDSVSVSPPPVKTFHKTFTFQKNSLDLTSYQSFAQFLDSLKENVDGQYNIVIEGHACDLGTDDHNLQLSKRRAELIRAHILDSEFEFKEMEVAFFGEQAPQVANHSETNRQINRRVKIILNRTP